MLTQYEKTNPTNQSIELGKVSWYRSYEHALALSKEKSKPILLFFQEIPGCSTCVNYGREVLSHPVMVEIIENEFIPLAIYNNKLGPDEEVLRLYNEPSWNNPVAHFIDENGTDIVKKLNNNYLPLSILNKIIDTLGKTKGTVPKYIIAFKNELLIKYGETITTIYETPCFWSGETTFAQKAGVYSTLPGFIGAREVVKIEYDPKIVTKEQLDEYAISQGFFTIDKFDSFRVDKEPEYYLKKTNYKYLPLTFTQRMMINYALPYKQDPTIWLSPKQISWLLHPDLEKYGHPKAYSLKVEQSWEFMVENFDN